MLSDYRDDMEDALAKCMIDMKGAFTPPLLAITSFLSHYSMSFIMVNRVRN